MASSIVDELVDRRDITELLTRFGRWLDGGSGEPGDFYHRDAKVVSPRAELRGLAAISEFLAGSRGEHTQHTLSDVLVELDGDRADVSANQFVHFFEPGQPPYRSSGLRVAYTLGRTPEGWRLTRAEIAMAWLVGDLPAASATP